MKELLYSYNKIKPNIKNRIREYKSVWENANEKKLFQELAFCLLTPQSKAVNAWATIIKLTENNKLFNGHAKEMSEDMNLIRFKNNKARYIENSREIFFTNSIGIRKTLAELKLVSEKRNWLYKNIKGYGLKESSHFLRNIGFVEDITILDRHILKNLKKYNVITEIPKSLSEKKYYEIEDKMKEFSEKISIPLEHLDLVFWHNETGKIFK